MKGLRLEQNFGYADAQYKNFTIYDYGEEDYVNFKNKKVQYTPNITNLSALQYTIPLAIAQSDFGLMLRVEYRYVGEVYYSFDNAFSSPDYSLVNTAIGIQSKLADVTFWTRNLGDTKYLTTIYDYGGGVYGLPRMYGATLSAKF